MGGKKRRTKKNKHHPQPHSPMAPGSTDELGFCSQSSYSGVKILSQGPDHNMVNIANGEEQVPGADRLATPKGKNENKEPEDNLSPLPEIKTNSRISADLSVNTKLPVEHRSDGMLENDSVEIGDHKSLFSPSHYPSMSHRCRNDQPYDTNTINSSRSLYAEDLDYNWENGRRYCGNYYMPNDDDEQDSMRIMHQVYLSVFDMELSTIELEDPTYILDIGTGTGDWAIAMGEIYPDCEVVGTDISAIQPTAVPYNVYFEIDDAELDWTRPENYADLIHLRHLSGAFSDWAFVYGQIFQTLKPGGYIEVVDIDDHWGLKSLFSHFPAGSEVLAMVRDLTLGAAKSGKQRDMTHLDPRSFIEAGFVDVTQQVHPIPLEKARKGSGKMWLVACLCSLEAVSLRLLTNYMGWTAERVRMACDELAQAIQEVALGDSARAREVVMNIKIVTGRKPITSKDSSKNDLSYGGNLVKPCPASLATHFPEVGPPDMEKLEVDSHVDVDT